MAEFNEEFNEEKSNELLQKLRPTNGKLSDSMLIKTSIMLLLGNGANPNAKYDDGKSVLTQAITNLAAVDRNNNKYAFGDRFEVIISLMEKEALLTEDDKTQLIRLLGKKTADALEHLAYESNKAKMSIASYIIFQMPGNPYLDSETKQKLAEYMGKGGKKVFKKYRQSKKSKKTKAKKMRRTRKY